MLLCKLGKIFPPGCFLPMQHLIVHLPYEAQMGGPVQNRWCYPIERCLKLGERKTKKDAREMQLTREQYLEVNEAY